MLRPKSIIAGCIVATLLLAGGLAMASAPRDGNHNKVTAKDIIIKAKHAYAALSSYSDKGTAVATMGGMNGGAAFTMRTAFSIHLQRPKLYRIHWSQRLFDGMTGGGAVWSDGRGSFFVMNVDHHEVKKKYSDGQLALAAGAGVSDGASSTIPEIFFGHKKLGDVLDSTNATLREGKDQALQGVDCYVVSWHTHPAAGHGKQPELASSGTTMTLWIDKKNFLIRQVRMLIQAGHGVPHLSDAEIKKDLAQLHEPATPAAVATLRRELKKASKMRLKGAITFTETHGKIVLDKNLPSADFSTH